MSIPVFYETVPVGMIDVTEDGPAFTYDPAWPSVRGAFPVSLRIPLAAKEAPPSVMVPWLMNLLPEGAPLLAVGRNLGMAPQDVLGIVEKVGRDTAGALSIGRRRSGEAPGYRPVPDDTALERIIEELPAKPFLAGEEGVSMSLAGAQEKLPVAMVDGKIAIPVNGAPSTHILKPDNRRLYGSVQNEALCLVLARRLGLCAAEAVTRTVGGRTYLLITRYDRRQQDGRWFRLHQEDFCQALGKPPGAKYQRNQIGVSGPGLKDLFELTRRHMSAADTLHLADATVLNVLLTNVDAHAKNYSTLLTGRGASLAPLYDLMCGAAWPNVTQNMAQDIGGKNRGRYIYARHWRRMAAECGLNARALVRRIEAMANKAAAEVDAAAEDVRAMPAGDHPMLRNFVAAIRERCSTVIRNLSEEGTDDEADDGADQAATPTLDEALSPPAIP
jgi:serine/threonine-protein kinase HipA